MKNLKTQTGVKITSTCLLLILILNLQLITVNAYANCGHYNISWRTYGHWNNTHTHEKYCTDCGLSLLATTRPCAGNCVDFNTLVKINH